MPLLRISNKMSNLWENFSDLWRGWPGFCAAFGHFYLRVYANPHQSSVVQRVVERMTGNAAEGLTLLQYAPARGNSTQRLRGAGSRWACMGLG